MPKYDPFWNCGQNSSDQIKAFLERRQERLDRMSRPHLGNQHARKDYKKSAGLSIKLFPHIKEKLAKDRESTGLSESEYVGRLIEKYKL